KRTTSSRSSMAPHPDRWFSSRAGSMRRAPRCSATAGRLRRSCSRQRHCPAQRMPPLHTAGRVRNSRTTSHPRGKPHSRHEWRTAVARSRVERRPAELSEQNEERRARTLVAGLLTALAAFVALWPYTSVVAAGTWSFVSVAVIIVTAAVGILVRQLRARSRVRDLWTLLAQLLAAICTLTVLVMPQGALLGMIPTSATIAA